jgi:hypothetical protein
MTSIPVTSDDSPPQEWSLGNQTLILSAGSARPLAVLNGRYPLLLPPGSVLQFDDPPTELVVTKIRVIVGDGGATVCAETAPARYCASAAPGGQAAPPRHLRPAPSQPPRWSRVRPGNG